MDLSTGVMSTGIKKINDKLYYFGSNGIMQTGLIHDAASDKYYYGQSDGTLVIGWLNLDGSYYHLEPAGRRLTVPNTTLIRLPENAC